MKYGIKDFLSRLFIDHTRTMQEELDALKADTMRKQEVKDYVKQTVKEELEKLLK